MLTRLLHLFRREPSDNQVVTQPTESYLDISREIIQPVHLSHSDGAAIITMPPPTTGIRPNNIPSLQLNRVMRQELSSRSLVTRSNRLDPYNNPIIFPRVSSNITQQPENPSLNRQQNRHIHHNNRRTDQLTQKQINRMISRDTKLINEFAVLTSGTAILAYNAASVPGFTLDPCMIQSSATLLGGLFFLYYIHISDARYQRYLDNRLVKIGIFCIILSLLSILINVITAALNYNSRFWVVGSSTSICIVSNSINSTSTTNSLSIRNHNNTLFVLCYLFCLFISLLPFLRLLIIVLDSWSNNNHNEDLQEINANENQRLHAAQREAFEINTRLQLQLNSSTDELTRMEEQLVSSHQEIRYLREAHAHHCSDSHRAALDLAHIDGNCHHIHLQQAHNHTPITADPTSVRTTRTDRQASHRVSFQS